MLRFDPYASKTGKAALAVIFCAAAALLAGVIFSFSQRLVEAAARAEDQMAADIAAETQTFCEKMGFSKNSREHRACEHDLESVRANHERRIYERNNGFL